jgi:hypothetical protein
MAATSPATQSDLEKLATTVRIRERIVQVTAEQLLDALDGGDEVMVDITRRSLRDALTEARDADNTYWAAWREAVAS